MKDLDFLEIGTSDFDTLIQICPDEAIGISIEPLKYYLDKLPNKPNVIKLQRAISFNEEEREEILYYIHPDEIEKYNLPYWLRGCNKIGEYHFQHTKLEIQHLVRKEKVLLTPISKILKEYNIRKINVLKIDTEGADCQILLSFFRHLQKEGANKENNPKQIIFENNGLTNPQELMNVLKTAKHLGYVVNGQHGDELHLSYLV